jgi:hypothetical protein
VGSKPLRNQCLARRTEHARKPLFLEDERPREPKHSQQSRRRDSPATEVPACQQDAPKPLSCGCRVTIIRPSAMPQLTVLAAPAGLPVASPLPRRSTSVWLTEVLRRGNGEATVRSALWGGIFRGDFLQTQLSQRSFWGSHYSCTAGHNPLQRVNASIDEGDYCPIVRRKADRSSCYGCRNQHRI